MSKKGIVDDGLALESAKTRLEFYFDEFEEAQAAVINDMQQGVSIKICGPRTREGRFQVREVKVTGFKEWGGKSRMQSYSNGDFK